MLQAQPPVDFAGTPAAVRSFAPRHGEHTDEVLSELGYGATEIEDLRAGGVLGGSHSEPPGPALPPRR